MKRKIHWGIIGAVLLVLLAAVVLIYASSSSRQAKRAICLPQKFGGEYSRDGSTWQNLEDDTEISALEGELFLRGHLAVEITQETTFFFYLDHIFFSLSVNGEMEINYIPVSEDMERDLCGNLWYETTFETLNQGDLIEIHLYNPHRIGNQNAYREFLDSIYVGPPQVLTEYLLKEGEVSRGVGLCAMIIAILLLGVALTYSLMQLPDDERLWMMGLLTFFMGGFIFLNTKDVSLWNDLVAFNTAGLEICQIMAAFFAGIYLASCLRTKLRGIAYAFMAVSGILDGILMGLFLVRRIGIGDAGWIWSVAQVGFCILLLGCGGYELLCRRRNLENGTLGLLSSIGMVLAILIDLLGGFAGWWNRGNCRAIFFGILLILYLVKAFRAIPANYRAAQEAKKMEAELREKNIAMMISQIQPHFIYNSLNAIRHLCKGIPEAQQAIKDFSDYLRGNLNSLDRHTPVSFQTELKHVQSYLALEKIRFEDELNVVYDIQTVNFSLPALTVQPLLENAVKHGVGQAPEGGTVVLATREYEEYFEIIISDNGVGFDPSKPPQDGKKHVGIENVRYRLWNMSHAILQISSEIGKGTRAVIKLPKEVDEDECDSSR